MPRLLPTSVPAAAVLAALVLPAGAGAATAGGGAVFAGPPPVVADAHCVRRCPSIRSVAPGSSIVQLVGSHLGAVTIVRFAGAARAGDDRSVIATPISDTAVEAAVPPGARTGPVEAVEGGGRVSAGSADELAVSTTTALDGGAVDLQVDDPRVVAGVARPAALHLMVRSGAAAHVDVRAARGGAPAATWAMPATEAGTVMTVRWDGRATGGREVTDVRYRFRVTPDGTGPATSPPFTLQAAVFPLLGPHRFGTGTAAYGAPRGGRAHAGQDVFARCGTPLVAARAGRVQDRNFQSAAGNYVVIDLDASAEDDMYAHLRAPGTVKVGQHVVAGQPIGEVGDTGDADGCHLHFETWTAPGWYEGGAPHDPTPLLRQWDRGS